MRNLNFFVSWFLTAVMAIACQPDVVSPKPDPKPDPPAGAFEVKVTAADGIMDEKGVSSSPKFTLVIEGAEADYTVNYTLDDKSSKIESVFPGEVQTFTVSDATAVGEHKFFGKVARASTGDEVSFNATAWLRWPPLSEAKATYSTATQESVPFGDKPITVDKNLLVTVNISYKDAKTPVEAVAFNHSSVSVKSFDKAADGKASMVVIPSAKTEEGWFGMILVNGNLRDTLVQKFVCTGEEAQGQTVIGFSVEGIDGDAVSVPMKGSLPIVIHPDPEKAVDAGEITVTSDNEGVFTVSGEGNARTILPVWPGTATMKICVGKVQKDYTVTVTGTPVSDFKIGGAFGMADWITGTEVTDLIIPVPADAFDADEMTVRSLSPEVLTVTEGAGGNYTFKAVSYGKATVEIATGHCSRKLELTVKEDLDLSAFDRTAISWGESQSFTVKGHYSDFFLGGNMDPDIDVFRQDNVITVMNNIHKSTTANKRYGKNVDLSFKTGDGTVYKTVVKLGGMDNVLSRTVSVNVKENTAEFVFRFKNGTDYPLSYEKMEGYIMSAAGEGNNSVDFYEKLQHGKMGADFCDSYGKLYARYYNFVKEFTGEKDGWINIPEMDITEFRMVINHTGDDFSSYKKGVRVYMQVNKGINPNDMEEWYW